MDLKDLKSAWNNYSSRDANRHNLDENAIRELLKSRTKSIVEKVDRNIKINFAVLFAILLFLIIGNSMVEVELPDGFTKPTWLVILDWFNITVLAGTFMYFAWRYRKIRLSYSINSEFRASLEGMIKTINIYKVLFYFALLVLLTVAIVEFISGMYDGAAISAHRQGGSAADLNTKQLFWAMIRGIGVLFLIVSIIFFLFRYGFKKLYGNYQVQLKSTLKELEEIE